MRLKELINRQTEIAKVRSVANRMATVPTALCEKKENENTKTSGASRRAIKRAAAAQAGADEERQIKKARARANANDGGRQTPARGGGRLSPAPTTPATNDSLHRVPRTAEILTADDGGARGTSGGH